jgi:hypothetical protein
MFIAPSSGLSLFQEFNPVALSDVNILPTVHEEL